MKYQLVLAILFITLSSSAQNETLSMDTLPYYQIPDYPKNYNQHTTVARVIDGLGYRYHWASKDLRAYDLAFLPGNDGGSCRDVIDHIAGLSHMVLNAVHNRVHAGLEGASEMTFEEVRKLTLENLQEASKLLKEEGGSSLSERKIIFVRGENRNEMEFWHILNGPLADAIYHTGQIVSYRRSAGNPIDPNVSVFMGRTREK